MAFDSRQFEFADIKVVVFGKELSGLRGLTYKKTQEKEVVYGAGSEGKGIQRGNKKYDGTLMILGSDFDDLNAAARTAGYQDITDVRGKDINIVVTYQKEDGGDLKTDSLINLEFTEFEEGMKQGDKFKEYTLPFIFLRLKQS